MKALSRSANAIRDWSLSSMEKAFRRLIDDGCCARRLTDVRIDRGDATYPKEKPTGENPSDRNPAPTRGRNVVPFVLTTEALPPYPLPRERKN